MTTSPEAFLHACDNISLEALQLCNGCEETILQLRTLLKSIQPQLPAGSAAQDLAHIACALADDCLDELGDKLPRLRRELGAAGEVALSPDSLATTP